MASAKEKRMLKYVIKRVLLFIPIMIAVTFLVYFLLDLAPGNPGRIILGENATWEDVEEKNIELGYDKPFVVRFFNYVKQIVKGDFGRSWRTNRPVIKEVVKRLPSTFLLAFLGVLVASLIGVPLGMISAVKQYSALDTISRVTAMLLAAVPAFWLGMLLLLLFALKLRWLPATGLGDFKAYILPIATIAIPQAASLLRFSRSTMLETIRQDYIRTARAKGVPENKVVVKHALRNALLPIITVMGTTFGRLMGGVVVIEQVFAIAGMGQFAMTGITMHDVPVVMASVIVLSAIFALIILLVDIINAFVDPRIRSVYEGKKKKKTAEA